MLRALWFFAQLAIVVCAAIWISAQQGAVDIVWNDYTLSVNLGIFLLFLTLFTIVTVAFFRLCGAIVALPSGFSRKRREKNRAKGFQALTRGFVAVAAGDAKKATGYARDVRRLMPDETGLPLLLDAQAARLRGEEASARVSFEQLLQDKDAAFFGIRGLVKSSLDAGDTVKALTYAQTALAQNPKQPWILKSVYDLQLQSKYWDAAYQTLERLNKIKELDPAQARSDEIALLMLLAEQERIPGNGDGWFNKVYRAYKMNPAFVPVAMKVGEHYLALGKTSKVADVVEKAWKQNPHPDLVILWDRIAPEATRNDPLRRLRWFEKLVAFKPDSAEGQLAAAKVALDSGLAGEAKAHVVIAQDVRPSASVYRLRADIEEQTTHNSSAVREWLDKASSAAPDPVWYCTLTGHIYERWSPVAQPHGSFNTIQWGNPLDRSYMGKEVLENWQDPLLIEKI